MKVFQAAVNDCFCILCFSCTRQKSSRTMKLSKLQFFAALAVVNLACVIASTEISTSSVNDSHTVSIQTDNDTHHNNSNHGDHHGNDTHHDDAAHGEHHGIHVASINFDYVKQPLVVTLFMLVVVLCKIGTYSVTFYCQYNINTSNSYAQHF